MDIEQSYSVPAEVVQLITHVGQLHGMHELSIRRRMGIEINDPEGIRFAMSLHRCDVGQALSRGLHRQLGGGIKRWIRLQQ